MTVTVNGTTRQLPGPSSIADLLKELGVATEGTAVALNGAVVPRKEHGTAMLAGGDVVEVIRAVAGG
ncbi:MAG: sulfur carrier protein ThiS [Gemmatimonadetes bacterium]|nr:sulfur carrier protein ThiS [Gemmatimonadota bacterium]MYH18842.1 sulfur carrier protein ThiS [Gemmatimonadota bacterium]MYK97572.1 sulfur carrier protein ThiS [Gemmatimonadota bacterium]